MTKHAVLSASGASRWLTCTPSARLEENFEDRAGAAAKEGTLAHRLGELLILLELIKRSPENDRELAEIKADPLYSKEMYAYCEDYAAFVIERYNFALSMTRDAILEQEVTLDLSKYIPEGFGTADNVIIGDGTLEIIDLKYGKGVPVDAVENAQMKVYALGALEKYDWQYAIDRVKMTIHQPRIDNNSTWVITVAELKQWANDVLIPAADAAFKGEGDFVPGTHCQFCRAAAVCKANSVYQLGIARADFMDPVLMDDNDIAEVLERRKGFLGWIKAVGEYALNQTIHNGKKWPGFKLVSGTSKRIYEDREKIESVLLEDGWTDEQIHEKKLLGVTAMQGLLTKKVFDTLVGPYVIKPMGKPALVLESDKRPELNSADAAKAVFADDLETDD